MFSTNVQTSEKRSHSVPLQWADFAKIKVLQTKGPNLIQLINEMDSITSWIVWAVNYTLYKSSSDTRFLLQTHSTFNLDHNVANCRFPIMSIN